MAKKITTDRIEVKYELDCKTLVECQVIIGQWIAKYGPDATLDITQESEPYSDTDYAKVYIIVKRLETDDEEAKRMDDEQARRNIQEMREKAEFERLKAKFEDKAK